MGVRDEEKFQTVRHVFSACSKLIENRCQTGCRAGKKYYIYRGMSLSW